MWLSISSGNAPADIHPSSGKRGWYPVIEAWVNGDNDTGPDGTVTYSPEAAPFLREWDVTASGVIPIAFVDEVFDSEGDAFERAEEIWRSRYDKPRVTLKVGEKFDAVEA